jgi:ceramide glucosyltransferase
LLPYAVETVADYKGLKSLLAKRTRWMTVMRAMRPWGHLGLLLTWGLPWALAAVAARPTAVVAASYLGGYLVSRVTLSSIIGIYGLRQKGLWPKFALIPAWDAMAFWIWLVSFTRKSILWRGVEHSLKDGQLVPPEGRLERERVRRGTAEETEAAESAPEI